MGIILMLTGLTYTVQANKTYLSLDSISMHENAYFCSSWDSVIIYKPTTQSAIQWQVNGIWQLGGDSIIITNPYNYTDGEITFMGNLGMIIIHLYFVEPLITPVFVDATVCGLGTVTLDAGNVGVGSYGQNSTSYLWSNGATTQTITVGAGSYSVTVNSVCGPVTSNTVTITENNPNPPVLHDTTLCTGGWVVLYPGDFVSYAWTGGSTDTSLTVTAAGTYSVTTTDIGGCTDVATMTLSLNPIPEEWREYHFCDGTTGQLDPGVYDNYTWSVGAPWTGQILEIINPGTYIVTVSNSNDGCLYRIRFDTYEEIAPIQPICLVTVDTITWKNKIMWEIPQIWDDNIGNYVQDPKYTGFIIYKEVLTNYYQNIGIIPASSPSEFIDMDSQPESHGDKYRISAIDTCANESPFNVHGIKP